MYMDTIDYNTQRNKQKRVVLAAISVSTIEKYASDLGARMMT